MSVNCSFCLNICDFGGDRHLHAIRCSHVYHGDCLSGWFKLRKDSCPICRFRTRPNEVVRLFLLKEPIPSSDAESDSDEFYQSTGTDSTYNKKIKLFFEKTCHITKKVKVKIGIMPIINYEEDPFLSFDNEIIFCVKSDDVKTYFQVGGFLGVEKFVAILGNLKKYSEQTTYTISDLMVSSSGGVYFLYHHRQPNNKITLDFEIIDRISALLPLWEAHWEKYNRRHVDTFYYSCLNTHGMNLIHDIKYVKSSEDDDFVKELIDEINFNFRELYKTSVMKKRKWY